MSVSTEHGLDVKPGSDDESNRGDSYGVANKANVTTDIEKNEPVVTAPEQKREVTGVKWFIFVVSTLTSIFVYALDNTIVADIVPAIVNNFNGIDKLPWLSVGFMIGGVAMIMPYGKLFALYDAKWVYIISTVIFMAASALCGAAPTMDAEIVGRVFAGVGGNGMYLGLLQLMSMHTTDKERPAYLSLTGMIWGAGTVLGPVVGGGFELYTWRWAFYINLLFGAILLPTYLFVIPSNDPSNGKSVLERARTFDYIGAILSVGGFTTIILAINFGGVLYPWNSGSVIALFVLSGVLWILFAVQQSLNIFTDKERRMFPVHLMANREAVLLFIACAAVGSVSYVTVYYIPIYFQFTRGDTAIRAAVRLLPYIFVLIFFILSSGYLMGRLGYYKPWYVVGSAIALVGSVLMSRVGVHTSAGQVYGWEILLGVGAGAYTQAAFAVIQGVVAKEDAGNGITLMLIAQLCGLAFGLAIGGAVFLNQASNGLVALLPDVDVADAQRIISGTSGDFLQSLPDNIQEAALNIIVAAWQNIFVLVYATAALSLLVSCFMGHGKVVG